MCEWTGRVHALQDCAFRAWTYRQPANPSPASTAITTNPKTKLFLGIAIPLGLIVSELVTNAAKHAFNDGFPVSDAPSIFVGLSMGNENSFCLEVCDNGQGFPENFDINTSASKGLTLINSLVKQMKAELVIANNNGSAVIISTKKNNE